MNHEFWYLSRAAGFTAYLLLFVAGALGIVVSTRFAERLARRNLIFDIHRFASILALAFSLFHVYVLLGDHYFSFGVWQLSLPFLSPYRNWQVAAGVFGLYLMAIVVASFYVRQFIGYRTWRTLHYVTGGMYVAVTLHGITAGTDTGEPWARLAYIGTGAAIFALLLYRLQHRLPGAGWVRAARLGTALTAAVVVGVLFTQTGLFTSSSANLASNARPVFLPTFSDADLSGTFRETSNGANSHLTLDGAASGDVPFKLAVDLVSQQSAGRAMVMSNSAQLLDRGSGSVLCDGTLTSLNNNSMSMTCTGAGVYDGISMNLAGSLNARSDGTFSGSLTGSMQRQG